MSYVSTSVNLVSSEMFLHDVFSGKYTVLQRPCNVLRESEIQREKHNNLLSHIIRSQRELQNNGYWRMSKLNKKVCKIIKNNNGK